MGQKIAKIFPVTDVEAIAPHTARHTNQLHSIPFEKATAKGRLVLIVAIPIAAVAIVGATIVLALNPSHATNNAPAKLPMKDKIQFLASWTALIDPLSRPESITKTFPVKSSAPVKITSASPAGRPTAPFKKLHNPGFADASAGEHPPTLV